MKKVAFLFTCDSAEDARIVEHSLSPEINHKIPKTIVMLERLGKTLSLTIESPDASSLRAACNSYLRWIQTALSVKNVV